MSKLTGVFDLFKNLDKISIEDVNANLTIKQSPEFLQNYIANRVIYPQTIPSKVLEMDIDLIFLKEVVKLNKDKFIDQKNKRILIPEIFFLRFTPAPKMVMAILDGLNVKDIYLIVKKGSSATKTLGTYIAGINFTAKALQVSVEGYKRKISIGKAYLFPVNKADVKVMGLKDKQLNVSGGELGIILDLRK
ncbi:hypothetical protein HYS91_03350 [Candidatus Daviesbacteria bacterium]|nr:hypothetical protein [Candidatus Daviesbacteria bacterium]